MAFRGGGEAELMRKIHGTGIRLYLVWWRMQPLRYGFKGLDNVLAGLLRSAPDARFIVPVRETGAPFINGRIVNPRRFVERISRFGRV